MKKAVNDVPAAEANGEGFRRPTGRPCRTNSTRPRPWPRRPRSRSAALAYSADGTQLASAGENNLVRTWQSDTGVAIETFVGHSAAPQAAAFTPAGVLSAAADGGLILWQARAELDAGADDRQCRRHRDV